MMGRWDVWRCGRTRMQSAIVAVMVLGLAGPAAATQKVLVTDDNPIPIAVSSYQLTLIKLPSSVVPNGLMTVNPAFEIRGNGRHIAIDTKNTTAPGDLVVMTESQSYVFQVTPKVMPAEMIVVEDVRLGSGSGRTESDPVRRSDSYPEANVELIQQTAQGALPRSCVPKDIPKEMHPKWLELEVVSVREYRCPQYTVRTLDLYNSKLEPQSLRQTEFFTGQELSIALDRTVIRTGESATVYIVLYTQPVRAEKGARRMLSPDPESGKGHER